MLSRFLVVGPLLCALLGSPRLALAECGNAALEVGEECDDGNPFTGDECDPNCTIPRCGNGIVARREQCDDGNLLDGDGCDSNCLPTRCGNGIVTAGEQCDDGNSTASDGCTADCTICGNGSVAAPEECDDGNLLDGDACDSNCTMTRCGNRIVTAGETCDDGNELAGDGCDSGCVTEPGWQCTVPGAPCTAVCGDGLVVGVEECEDGNTSGCDGCSSLCLAEPLGASWCFVGGPEEAWVNVVTIDPARPSVVYAGTKKGVFKSVDRGQTWVRKSTDLAPLINLNPPLYNLGALDVRALAVSSMNPDLLLAAGGNALSRSTSAGDRWTLVSDTMVSGGTSSAISVTPTSPQIYAAGSQMSLDRGLWVSTDGTQWDAISLPLPGSITSVAQSPLDARTLYATFAERASGEYRVIKTADGGATWSYADDGLPRDVYYAAIAVTPESPAAVYVAGAGGVGHDGLFRSLDEGQTWESVLPNVAVGSIALDWQTPRTLYLPDTQGVRRSIDAGSSWEVVPIQPAGIVGHRHAATHVAVDPTDSANVFVATNRGVLRSTSGLAELSPATRGLSATHIRAILIDRQRAGTLYALTRTWGGSAGAMPLTSQPPATAAWVSRDAGASWAPLFSPDDYSYEMVSLLIDPVDSSILYLALSNWGFRLPGEGEEEPPGLLKSTDGGTNWAPVGPGTFRGTDSLLYLGATESEPPTLYLLFQSRLSSTWDVLASTDRGSSWTKLSSWPPGFRTVGVDPTAPGTLYVTVLSPDALHEFLRILKTTDFGETWAEYQVNSEPMGGIEAYQIIVDRAAPSRLYLPTRAGGLFKSVDGGRTWVPKIALDQGSPPNPSVGSIAIHTLAIDPRNPATLYAADRALGLFVSTDAGNTWRQEADPGLANLGIDTIAIADRALGSQVAGIRSPGAVHAAQAYDGAVAWVGGEPEDRSGSVLRKDLPPCVDNCQREPQGDHYKGYSVSTKRGTAEFQRRVVSLAGSLYRASAIVLSPESLLNPVSKNAEAVRDPTAHLECYKIKTVPGEPRLSRRRVLVHNQFGFASLTVAKRRALCIPSEKNGQGSALNLDHFQCFNARASSRTARPTVSLADQFETLDAVVLKPAALCEPVDKDGGGIRDPEALLTCYTIHAAPGVARFGRRDVTTRNQFGSETLTVKARQALCVPSLEE